MQNPDPKKYKIKKLRGKGYILVDKQVLRWRKDRKYAMQQPKPLLPSRKGKKRSLKPKKTYNMFQDDES